MSLRGFGKRLASVGSRHKGVGHRTRYGPNGNACNGGQYVVGRTDRMAALFGWNSDTAWLLRYSLQGPTGASLAREKLGEPLSYKSGSCQERSGRVGKSGVFATGPYPNRKHFCSDRKS